MPARTRIAKRLAITSGIIFLGIIIARAITPETTPSYKLSNSAVSSNDGIAINTELTGQQLPQVDLTTITGEIISTRTLTGTPMIINIWYSTCEPCRRELPVLASAAVQYLDQVRFVGVNIKDSASVAKEFAAQYGVEFELLLDTNGPFISELGIATAPVTLAVDAQGVIIDQVAGEMSASELDKLVKELLK